MEYAIIAWYVKTDETGYAQTPRELPRAVEIDRTLAKKLDGQALELYQHDEQGDRVVVAIKSQNQEGQLHDQIRKVIDDAGVESFKKRYEYHGAYANSNVCDTQFMKYANRPLS